MAKPITSAPKKRLNLAIQGGGAHGAFAWGALDRLLEDERLEIEGIVGTSAGAMNASVCAYGLHKGGNQQARASLTEFWTAISRQAARGFLRPSPIDRLRKLGSLDFSPGWIWSDFLAKQLSPYQLNPWNLNPLRDVLLETIDFDDLRGSSAVKLFLCASNVMTGKLRVFDIAEMRVECALASGCLPFLFQAVEIDGEHYWDGGYMGNPPIFPIIYNCEANDVMMITVNPIAIKELPTTAQTILDRVNTLSFNSSLMREMRAINFVSNLVDSGFDDGGRLKKLNIHCLEADEDLADLGVSSKLNADWDFLRWLFELGRAKADEFLETHYDSIGARSSTDIVSRYL